MCYFTILFYIYIYICSRSFGVKLQKEKSFINHFESFPIHKGVMIPKMPNNSLAHYYKTKKYRSML